MKKHLLFLLICFNGYQALFAQAPQGVNYQAIALDVSGNAVANQSIKIRLSILDGSATGTIVYEETHSTTTDNTGLFSLVIGNGTVSSGTFNSINWGNGTKWLKTEIDITGGTNYALMGSSQFMSTPYALYANKASFSSGSLTMPDGLTNVTSIVIPDSTNYIVPAGKNLYIPSSDNPVAINGDSLYSNLFGSGANARTFIGASENSLVWVIAFPIAAFLVDKTVEWGTYDIKKASFTVPAGKQFVIVNTCSTAGPIGEGTMYGGIHNRKDINANCKTTLNNVPCLVTSNMILEPGTILSTIGCNATSTLKYFVINGYFMDK